MTGPKSNCSRSKSIVCAIGAATDCFALAILHTPCHRQAALALISRFKMPLPPPIYSRQNCGVVQSPLPICDKCSCAADGRRGWYRGCRYLFIVEAFTVE